MNNRDRRATLLIAAIAAVGSPRLALAQQPTATGASSGPARGAAVTGEITLAVGEQYSLPATNIRSFSEGVPGIADIRVPSDGSRLLVVGQRAGSTSLLVIRGDGTQQTYAITVFRMAADVVRAQVTQLLQGYSGVTINQIGGRLFLEGGVASEQQQRRVQQIAGIFPGQVESLVSVDPTIVERRINVRIDLYFVELSRNSRYVFGIGWPGSIGGGAANINATYTFAPSMGPGSTGLTDGNITAIIAQPLPRLDIASNAGYARVHRQATVITANGHEATYFSGGEVNFPTVGALGTATVQRIEFGSVLNLTPRFDPSTSRVDVRVQADLSDLVETGSAIPGRNVSRINTLVNLQLGQSIVLSGFRGRSASVGSQGLPGLAQIPILGALFGSQARQYRDNEMVIFVVPSVIEGMSRQAEDRVASALRAYEDFGGGVRDNTLVPRPIQRAPSSGDSP